MTQEPISRRSLDTREGIPHTHRMRSLTRAFLAAVFLFGQTAFALHHHDADRNARSPASSSRRSDAALSSGDNCFLCAAQIQPRTSVPEPVAVAAAPVAVVLVADVPARAPRAVRPGRVSDRSPPDL
jgi:hypothetical protein